MELKITLNDLSEVNPTLSVVLKKEKLEEVRTIIEKRHKSISNFSRIISCSPQFLHRVIKGEKNPKLTLTKKMTDILNIELKEIVEKITSRCNPHGCFIPVGSFPILGTSELASLVGHSFGDGHIGSRTFSFTNRSQRLIEDVVKKVHNLPTKNLTMNKRFHKAMSIRFPSLVKDILVAAGSQKGNKVKLRFKLPDWIKQGSFEIKKAFLQALFDDESTVNIKSRQIWVSLHKRIEIIDNLHQFFEEMGCMLKEFGINGITITQCHLRESSNGKTLEKRLTICGLLNFRKFKENINFLHPHKRKKLGILIRSIKHIKPGTKECRRKIINVLKRNPGLKFSDIAKLASVSPAATFNHLRKMEKNDLVIRTKFSNKTPFQWFLVEEQFMWFFHHQN